MNSFDPIGRPHPSAHMAPLQRGVLSENAEVEVSVVLPCLNEADSLTTCIAEVSVALAEMGMSGEIVVVDNGSSDGSVEVASAGGARVVLESERGYGSACRRGLREARGRFLVMGDADGTYDFSALSEFVAPLVNGADMVLGDRLNDSMEKGAMPWLHRHVGNPFLTWTMNALFGGQISDAHCGLRSIKKDSMLALDLSATGMEFASELLVMAMRHGVRIHQVPISYRRRIGGKPKLRTIRDGLRHLRLLVTMWGEARRWSEQSHHGPSKREILGYLDYDGRGERDADRLRL